jgi:hypothetical protein
LLAKPGFQFSDAGFSSPTGGLFVSSTLFSLTSSLLGGA